VWKLESEAFKKPIKVEICYDEEDKQFFNSKLEEVQKKLDTYISLSDKLEAQITDQDEQIKAYEVMLSRYETLINEYEKKLSQKEKE
jgi:septal ring factor EnvC (AmiA/AmiB activator)